MYKYFKELENPDNIKIYLLDSFGRKNRIISSKNLINRNLSFAFIEENKELFHKLQELDKFILGHKKENLDKIYGCSWDVWEKYVNTLIRFSGFHKVESSERKITTASLYGVELFKAYLEKGWDLYIVPPIVYDAYIDDVLELDFHSYYVEKHFDQVLSDYDGKGRVLVRDINC